MSTNFLASLAVNKASTVHRDLQLILYVLGPKIAKSALVGWHRVAINATYSLQDLQGALVSSKSKLSVEKKHPSNRISDCRANTRVCSIASLELAATIRDIVGLS